MVSMARKCFRIGHGCDAVRDYRLSSKRRQTLKAAESPQHFGTEIIVKGSSVLVPKVSSERRRYIPLGFIGPETFCSDLVFLIPDATLYHFGVLHSQFHNAWMRTVAGRLKSDYRYSGGIIYNNFIWPDPTPEQRAAIESCAQGVLNAREAHPGATLADLYDPDKMPTDLLSAHKELDAAVEAAYDVDFTATRRRLLPTFSSSMPKKQVSYSRFAGFPFGKMQAFHSVLYI